jgi:hypothetical protein
MNGRFSSMPRSQCRVGVRPLPASKIGPRSKRVHSTSAPLGGRPLPILPREIGHGLAEEVAGTSTRAKRRCWGGQSRVIVFDGEFNGLGAGVERHHEFGGAEVQLVPATVLAAMAHNRSSRRRCSHRGCSAGCRKCSARVAARWRRHARGAAEAEVAPRCVLGIGVSVCSCTRATRPGTAGLQ